MSLAIWDLRAYSRSRASLASTQSALGGWAGGAGIGAGAGVGMVAGVGLCVSKELDARTGAGTTAGARAGAGTGGDATIGAGVCDGNDAPVAGGVAYAYVIIWG